MRTILLLWVRLGSLCLKLNLEKKAVWIWGRMEKERDVGWFSFVLGCVLNRQHHVLSGSRKYYTTTLGSYTEVRLGSHLGNFSPFETSLQVFSFLFQNDSAVHQFSHHFPNPNPKAKNSRRLAHPSSSRPSPPKNAKMSPFGHIIQR